MIENGKFYKIISNSAYLKEKYGENIVAWVEGTDIDVMGKPWTELNGNIAALLYAARTGFERIPAHSDNTYYCKIQPLEGHGRLGEYIHQSEFGEETTQPD